MVQGRYIHVKTKIFSPQMTNSGPSHIMTDGGGFSSDPPTCAQPRIETENVSEIWMRTGTWSAMGSVSGVLPPLRNGRTTRGWRFLLGMQIWSGSGSVLWTLSAASACI